MDSHNHFSVNIPHFALYSIETAVKFVFIAF